MKFWGYLDINNPGYAAWYGEYPDEETPDDGGYTTFVEIQSGFPGNWDDRYNLTTHVWEFPIYEAIRQERRWRNDRLTFSDIPFMIVQDGNHKAVGTVQEWVDYRNALRDWPEHPNFMDVAYRPVKPS